MSAERSAAWVRRWVNVYTRGLPAEIRQQRRDEIDDDLWCQAREAAESNRADRSLAGEMLARLVFGVPADVSWRMEQRQFAKPRPGPERSLEMHARLPAVLALVGGASWTIWPIYAGLLSDPASWQRGGFGPTLTLVIAVCGTVALALALVSLVAAARDMIPGLIATVAVVGAFISALAVVGFWQAGLLLPLSSIVVVWQLSRVGTLPRWIFWMHVAAPIFVVALFVIGLTGFRLPDDIARTLVWLVVVLWLYPLSWLAIGWSLLRSRPVAADGVAGAGAA